MSALKYVCLSDLHLGADYSVLTQMDDAGKTTLLEPSATLRSFGTALREYVRTLSGPELPTLILLGDVLDLGLSPTGAVAQGFRRFIEALFPEGEPQRFSSQVLCVPGNHDHHLWRTGQDQYFLDELTTITDKKRFIPGLLEHTQLFAPQQVPCGLMTRVMRSYAHLESAEANVWIAYPNLGLVDETRTRCIVLHHGHYIDAVYRAMSTLNVKLRGEQRRPKTVAQIERENGAWVDFLWSGLGGGGAIARDATTLYETTRDPLASHAFAQKLSKGLLAELSNGLGVGPTTEITRGITVSNVVKGAVDLVLLRWAESERDSYFSIMSPDGVADLRWYLEGPVQTQIAEVNKKRKPGDRKIDCRDMSFVFGHTHKPFQEEFAVDGYRRPVAVYNTGGWVMDQPTMAPTQGAAAVFIDDALRVASLRLFNDPVNGVFAPVRAIGVGGYRDEGNQLLERMQDALRKAPWQAFSDAAAAALEVHARALLKESYARELRA